MMPVRLEPGAPGSRVKHSTTELPINKYKYTKVCTYHANIETKFTRLSSEPSFIAAYSFESLFGPLRI